MTPTRRRHVKLGCATALMLILAGCATEPARDAQAIEVEETLVEWRTEEPAESDFDVQPLADPDIVSLRERASEAEAAGDFERARDLLDAAYTLSPTDPETLQRLAALSLATGELELAAQRAMMSYKVGPKVGRLCQRNWLTFAESYRRLGDQAQWHRGMERLEGCLRKERERL